MPIDNVAKFSISNTNKNNGIDKSEFQNFIDTTLKSYADGISDMDGDGIVSRGETRIKPEWLDYQITAAAYERANVDADEIDGDSSKRKGKKGGEDANKILQEVRSRFNLMDTDLNGTLSKAEIQSVFEKGLSISVLPERDLEIEILDKPFN